MQPIKNIVADLPKGKGGYGQRNTDEITAIVVHHSAADPAFGPYDFAKWHIDGNGWPGIGYHYVIMQDGTTYQTNLLSTVSYQTQGHNTETLGICLAGNFDEYKPPKAQMQALGGLIRHLRKDLPSVKEIKAHRDYKSTSCPGSNLDIDEVRRLAEQSGKATAVKWLFGFALSLAFVGIIFVGYKTLKA